VLCGSKCPGAACRAVGMRIANVSRSSDTARLSRFQCHRDAITKVGLYVLVASSTSTPYTLTYDTKLENI